MGFKSPHLLFCTLALTIVETRVSYSRFNNLPMETQKRKLRNHRKKFNQKEELKNQQYLIFDLQDFEPLLTKNKTQNP
jgi:hypothetical protein